MKHFLLILTISLILLAIWFLTYLSAQYPAQPHLYVQAAPLWHISLFVLWFGVQVYAGICLVYWFWGHQLRRQRLAHQSPYHTR
jgi:hypothetical protein